MSDDQTASGEPAHELGTPPSPPQRPSGLRPAEHQPPPPTFATQTLPPPLLDRDPTAGRSQPDPPKIVRLQPAWLAAIAVVAVAADFALRRPPWNNLATTTLLLLSAAGLALTGRTSKQQKMLLGGAALFGVFLSLRTDPRLIAFNLIASLSLLGLATMPGAALGDLRLIRTLRHALETIAQPFVLIADLGAQYRARTFERSASPRAAQVSAIVRGLLIAGPLVVLLGLLLASADVVFASFFSTSFISPGEVIGHGVLLTIGGAAMATALSLTYRDAGNDDHVSLPTLGRIEALTILGALDLLFLVFAVAQLVARSETGGAVLEAGGLSYKEYARQGFFQLLWVAGITLAVLLVLRAGTSRWSKGDRAFIGLSLTAVALTMLIVVVAFSRLQLYIDDNGLTPLRFYSSAFSIWVGVAFLLVALRMVGWRHGRDWMLSGLVGSGLAALFFLNVLSPERVIAENLLSRGDAPILWHMHKLSGDGRAVLADGIERLPADVQEEVVSGLCDEDEYQREYGRRAEPDGLLDWNLGDARADQALDQLCR